MNEKLFRVLIGVVLAVVALSIVGYTLAYTQSRSSETDMPMMDDDEHDMMEHMEEHMEEMMELVSDEEFQDEMVEHMETCPMMKRMHMMNEMHQEMHQTNHTRMHEEDVESYEPHGRHGCH